MNPNQGKIIELENRKTRFRQELIALTTEADKVGSLLDQILTLDKQIEALKG